MSDTSGQGMYDLTGWHKVRCHDSDDIRPSLTPVSSLTDLSCEFTHDGLVYTEWALAGGTPTLRDYRWTNSDRPCEHYEADILVPLPQEGEPCV